MLRQRSQRFRSGAETSAICPVLLSQQVYAAAFNAACGTGTPFYGQYQIYDPYSVSVVGGHPIRQPLCGNKIPASHLRNATMASLVNSWLPTPTNSSVTAITLVIRRLHRRILCNSRSALTTPISDNDRVFFRFTRNTFTQALPGLAPGGIDTRQGPKWVEVAALGWNHVFNASTNLDVTFAGSNMETSYNNYPGYNAFPPTSEGLPGYLQAYAGATATFPNSCWQQCLCTRHVRSEYLALWQRAQLSVVLSHRHCPSQSDARVWCAFVSGWRRVASTKLRSQATSVPAPACSTSTPAIPVRTTEPVLVLPAASNYGLSYAAFLMGVQSNATATKQATVSLSTPYYSAYIGDTWRVTPKLTFMPGVRFEEEYGPAEKHNSQVSSFDPNQSLAIAAPR